MNNQESIESFREKLEQEYEWPALYIYKFIVPSEKIGEVKALFPMHEVSEKASSNGNYISLTARVMAESSQSIINVYLEANKIEGLIAL